MDLDKHWDGTPRLVIVRNTRSKESVNSSLAQVNKWGTSELSKQFYDIYEFHIVGQSEFLERTKRKESQDHPQGGIKI